MYCVCVCISLSLSIYIYIYTRTRICICILYVYVCIYIYIYIYIYTHVYDMYTARLRPTRPGAPAAAPLSQHKGFASHGLRSLRREILLSQSLRC